MAANSADVTRARDTLDIIHDISQLLDTGLDRETLAILVSLCEYGVNPESLAAVVRELRQQVASNRNHQPTQSQY